MEEENNQQQTQEEVKPQVEKRTLFSKLRTFFIECKRVFKVTKKPSKEEFKITVKVSAIGIGIIGLIGFIVHIVGVLAGL